MTAEQWLNNNKLSLDIWSKKYRYQNESFEEWLDRVSGNNPEIKRLIRENYRLIKNDLKQGYNIVFLWNKKDLVENANFHVIKEDMYKLLKKAELLS